MARAEAGKPEGRPTGARVSQPSMAKAVLQEHHSEMHVKEISQAIKVKFGVEIKPSYLAPVLFRQLGATFYKSKKQPNTFGLTAWKAENNGDVRAKSLEMDGVLITEDKTGRADTYRSR